jgi:hypothetical protein
MQIASLQTNSSLQNTPRYQFSLKSETINNLRHFKITLDINVHWNQRTLKLCRFYRRCHGNREHMSKSLTSLISETTKGISTRLGIWLVEYFDQKNRDRMAADKIGIISMFSDFNEHWYQGLFWSVANC